MAISNEPNNAFTSSDEYLIKLPPSRIMAELSADGSIKIDWTAVELVAAEVDRHDILVGWAKIMLAIRDGTWKPISVDN